MTSAAQTKSLRVLLVEDEEADAELLLHHLRNAGYDVTCSRVETESAMQTALTDGAWDVVISDYLVPGFGALPALAVMQSRGLDLPFIVISGAVGEEKAVATMKAGAHDFLLKDRWDRLVPALERELGDAEGRREHRRVEAERQRLIGELRDALANVRVLSGLLPVCAWCKKIRDDEGYWQDLERYVAAHSDAHFTHGICPECRRQWFSECAPTELTHEPASGL